MRHQKNSLQEEMERFVAFGQVLDRDTRQYFVAFLFEKLTGQKTETTELKSDYFYYFSDALEDLFDDPNLKMLVQKENLLADQIVVDTLHWFRKAYREVATKHPYVKEQEDLESWAVRHLRQFTRSYTFLIQKVSSLYPREELDIGFHQEAFRKAIGGAAYEELSSGQMNQIERVFKDLLAQWDARLQAKILQYQLRHLQKAKEQEYQKLVQWVKPFQDYASRYWDMSRALWKDQTLDLVERYHRLLQREDELQRLADLLGRLRKAELETEETSYEKTMVRKEWVKDPNLRSEIAGVKHDNDLNQLLPQEVALFGDDTEWQFLKRFAESELQVHRFEDDQLIESNKLLTETYQRVKEKKKGPFIVCVDTSGSMEGEPERIAKVLCFGILKMAAAQDRPAYLINFSSGIQTIDLYHLVDSMDAVADFLQRSFHGGTDISLALAEALKQLQQHQYERADVLVISDFVMYKISDDILQQMEKQQQQHQTRFYSLLISDEANENIIGQFDQVWQYHPEEKNIMELLFHELQGMMRRQF